MNRLPLEIVNRILEYDGRIKYRHGKYMNQIAHDDDRYQMLQTIPQIELEQYNEWIMTSYKNNFHIYKCKTSYSYLKPKITIISDDRSRSYCFDQDCICIYHVFYRLFI